MPVVSTNTAANSAVRYLNINSKQESESLSKIASGSRINQASDDAAGLAISTRISSDVTALQQAATNASHGVSVLQTADGGAANISDILQRMKTLASESSSGTVTDTERSYIDAEFQQLIEEIDGTATSTRYNGKSLLDGVSSAFAGTGTSIMVGSDASDTINVKIETLTAAALGLSTTATATDTSGTVTTTTTNLSVANQTDATSALTLLDTAIDKVSKARAEIGATESRFEFRSESIATQEENLESANSAIKDVDVASEQAKLASAEVKTQAAVAAAAQANQMPQALLSLLK